MRMNVIAVYALAACATSLAAPWPPIVATHRSGTVVASQAGRTPVPSTPRRSNAPLTIGIGGFPRGLAVDDRDGYVFVANGGLTVLNSHPERAVRKVDPIDAPDIAGAQDVTIDPVTHHLFVVDNWLPDSTNSGDLNYHNPDGAVVTIDLHTGRHVATVEIGEGPVAAAVDSRTRRVFVLNLNSAQSSETPALNEQGVVSILDAGHGRLINTTVVGIVPDALAVDEATGRVFVANRDSHTVSLLDGRTGLLLRTIPLDLTPYAVAVAVDAPTGRVFVAGGEDSPSGQSVRILDANSGKVVQSIAAGHGAQALAIDPTSGHVFVATDNGVAVVDGRSGAVLRSVAVGGEPVAIAVDSRTGHAFVADYLDDSVTVLNASGLLLRTLRVGSRPRLLAVDTISRRVFVTNSDDSTVSVLDADTIGKSMVLPPAPPSPILRRIGQQKPVQVLLDVRRNHAYVINAATYDLNGHPIRSAIITMIDASTGQALPTALSALPIKFLGTGAIVESTGRIFIVAGTAAGKVMVVAANIQTGRMLRTTQVIPPGPYGTTTLTVDQADNRVFAVNSIEGASSDTGLYSFDATSGLLLWTKKFGTAATISVDDRTSRVFVADGSYPNKVTIRVLSTDNGSVVRVTRLQDVAPAQLIVDAPADRVFVAASSSLWFLDAHSGIILRHLHGHPNPLVDAPPTIILDPPTNHLFVSNLLAGGVTMLDARTGTMLRTSDGGGAVAYDDARAATIVYDSGAGDDVGNSFYGSVVDARTGKALPGFRAPGALIGVDQDSGHLWASDLGPGEGLLPSTTTRFLTLDGRTGTVLHILTLEQSSVLPIVDDRTRRAFLADPPNGALLYARRDAPVSMISQTGGPTAAINR